MRIHHLNLDEKNKINTTCDQNRLCLEPNRLYLLGFKAQTIAYQDHCSDYPVLQNELSTMLAACAHKKRYKKKLNVSHID